MTIDDRKQRILEERAARLAKAGKGIEVREPELEIAICAVGSEQLGLPVGRLREIVALPKVTRLPDSPLWLRGVAQVRGLLVTVVDLATFLHLGDAGTPLYLALFDAARGPIAFTVDRVLSFRQLFPGDVSTASGGGRVEGRVARGVTRDLVVVVDSERLLSHPDLLVGREAT
jgi:purine-binding chemotaxis protein CheW